MMHLLRKSFTGIELVVLSFLVAERLREIRFALRHQLSPFGSNRRVGAPEGVWIRLLLWQS